MKRYKTVLLALYGFTALFVSSCELIVDKHTTAEISAISVKPTVVLLGEPIISLLQGSAYSDAGVGAEAGSNNVSVDIVSGEVNANTEGLYVVTYRAENEYGWASYAYRTVLVHDGTPYENELIGGNYKIGFKYNETITEHSVFGFWQMSSVVDNANVKFPVVFAEATDGTLVIVPGVDTSFGRYSGTGEFVISGSTKKIKFKLNIIPLTGEPYTKNIEWTRK